MATYLDPNNQITGNFAKTALTQAKTGLVSNNTLTGAGAAGSRSAGFGSWGYPDPTVWGHTTFQNNTISGTSRGIALYTDQSSTISQNSFDHNGDAVWLGLADPADAQPDATTLNIRQNSFTASDSNAVNNTLTGKVNATPNYWGSANGPANAANTFNVGSQGGAAVNVNFVPWWSTITGNPGTLNGTVFAPVTTTNPANGQFSSIQAAVTAAPSGTVSAVAGTFTETVTVGKTVTINGVKHGVDARTGRGAPSTETILDAKGGPIGFSLNADGITLDGFTVQNAGATANDPNGGNTGVFLSATHSGYQVLNNIIQNNAIGLYGNSQGTTQTLIKQNLMQNNNATGAASGNAIYADQGSVNILIDNNKFVNNVQGGSASFNGLPGTPQHDITVSNNNATDDISFVNANTVTVSNNTSTSTSLGSLIIIAGGVNGVSITGNNVSNAGNVGANSPGSAVLIGDFYGYGPNQTDIRT
ncbi:MAG: hypothetical protein ACR2M3_01835 [Thermomicrobiales bacterium]